MQVREAHHLDKTLNQTFLFSVWHFRMQQGLMISGGVRSEQCPSLLCVSVRAQSKLIRSFEQYGVWLGCGEKYRERQKRSDCTLDTVSCQNAYFAACPLHTHLIYSTVTKSSIQQIFLPRCTDKIFVHFSLKPSFHSCLSSYLLIHCAVVYSYGDKTSSGRVLIHSHLWIELKLSCPHLVVTGGMCR